MKSLICLFVIILLPLISAVEGGLLGGKKPVNVTDENVVAVAKFAVSKHNLVYEKVVRGTEQVVSGKKYDLIIAAKNGDGGAIKNYEAVVVERLWEKPSMILESFKAL